MSERTLLEHTLYDDIAQGLREALAYERGELNAKSMRLTRSTSDDKLLHPAGKDDSLSLKTKTSD